MPKKWNFLSNYGLVLTHLFQNSQATLREIARGTDLTERAVYQIVRELEESGFIGKKRVGGGIRKREPVGAVQLPGGRSLAEHRRWYLRGANLEDSPAVEHAR